MKVNIFKATSKTPKLIAMLELHGEGHITIARANKPVAQLVAFQEARASSRIGAAKGMKLYADDWDSDATNAEVAALFGVMSISPATRSPAC